MCFLVICTDSLLLRATLFGGTNVATNQVNKKAQSALDMLEDTHWPIGAQVKLGAVLIKLLIETACWTHDEERGVAPWDTRRDRGSKQVGMPQAAFIHDVVQSKTSRQGSLTLAPEIFNKVTCAVVSALSATCENEWQVDRFKTCSMRSSALLRPQEVPSHREPVKRREHCRLF